MQPQDVLSVLKERLVEMPEMKRSGQAAAEQRPIETPQISERDFITATMVNNNRFIKNFRDKFNIIERSYRTFHEGSDYSIIDGRIRYMPKGISSTEELILSSFIYELDRLLNNIITLRNSDKLLSAHLINVTNKQELDSLIVDIRALITTIRDDIDTNYKSHCIIA